MDYAPPTKRLSAGDRDKRIELQSPTESNDGGQLIITYTTVATVWATVVSWKGRVALEAARTTARQIDRFGMLYRDDVTDKWRIVWKGQAYNIVYIDRSKSRDGELWITAQVVGEQ